MRIIADGGDTARRLRLEERSRHTLRAAHQVPENSPGYGVWVGASPPPEGNGTRVWYRNALSGTTYKEEVERAAQEQQTHSLDYVAVHYLSCMPDGGCKHIIVASGRPTVVFNDEADLDRFVMEEAVRNL